MASRRERILPPRADALTMTSSLAWQKVQRRGPKSSDSEVICVFWELNRIIEVATNLPCFGVHRPFLPLDFPFHHDDDSGGGNPLASEAPGGRRRERVRNVLKEPRIRCRRRRGIHLGPASAAAARGAGRYRCSYRIQDQDQQDQQGSSQGHYY